MSSKTTIFQLAAVTAAAMAMAMAMASVCVCCDEGGGAAGGSGGWWVKHLLKYELVQCFHDAVNVPRLC
jgi:hypothetical protein